MLVTDLPHPQRHDEMSLSNQEHEQALDASAQCQPWIQSETRSRLRQHPFSQTVPPRQITLLFPLHWFRNQLSRVALRRSEEHTSELQSQSNLVCRLLLEKKKKK